MVDIKEIKAQLKRAGMTQTELARSVEMDPSTLNRKINNSEGETLTVKEATQIAETLKIPRDMLTNIFFASRIVFSGTVEERGEGSRYAFFRDDEQATN